MTLAKMSFDYFYRRWALCMSIINLLGFSLALWLGNHIYWGIGVLIFFVIYVASVPRYTHRYRAIFGLANWVTILRLSMCLIFFLVYPNMSDGWLFAGFLLVISLDGVDGYLARKLNQSSEVGGNLDMETDAFLVFALSWIHYDQNTVGWWILVPGGLKYAYTILFSWSSNKIEFLPKMVRATIAVIFFISLCLAFILPESFTFYLLLFSSVLICLSFASSIYFDLKTMLFA